MKTFLKLTIESANDAMLGEIGRRELHRMLREVIGKVVISSCGTRGWSVLADINGNRVGEAEWHIAQEDE